jgi:hypothetical protein
VSGSAPFRRVVSMLVAVSTVGLCLAAPAMARADQPGFAIDAVGFESYFHYRIHEGAERTGVLRVVNRSRAPMVVMLRPADVTTAATGGLEYGTRAAGGDGRWLKLSRRTVRLARGEVENVRFRVRMPRRAEPGDHFAGIVALNRADVRAARRRGGPAGVRLRFLPRLAIAVQATVPGGRGHELTTGAAGISVAPAATEGTLAVRNTGDLLIDRTEGDLALMQGDTLLDRRYLDLGAFVPNTEIKLRVPFEGTPARGDYRLVGTLRPAGGRPVQVNERIHFGDVAARELKRDTGIEARASGIPVPLAIGAGAALLLALTTLAALLRRQRRMIAELSATRAAGE